jgi:hypothetical protein
MECRIIKSEHKDVERYDRRRFEHKQKYWPSWIECENCGALCLVIAKYTYKRSKHAENRMQSLSQSTGDKSSGLFSTHTNTH